jgi:hypothetical protein
VKDLPDFEYRLNNIIIGRDKISVNLSRFNRSDGVNEAMLGMRTRREVEVPYNLRKKLYVPSIEAVNIYSIKQGRRTMLPTLRQ